VTCITSPVTDQSAKPSSSQTPRRDEAGAANVREVRQMRARTLPDGTLVITYAAWLELGSAVVLMLIAAWAFLDPTVGHRVAGWVCAGLALLLFALYERSVFEFRPQEGRVNWTRVRLLQRKSGSMPYDALDAVAVETEYGPPYLHRLALVTSAGRVPLTSAYDDAHERVAALGRAIQAAVRSHHELPIRA
jgi:hypothetical protein